MRRFEECWLAQHGVWEGREGEETMPPCNGQLVKVHIVPQQIIKLHVGKAKSDLWKPAVWRWACGGIMGNTGHHGHFDVSRRLRIPRSAVPAETEAWATDYGLEWWLDRTYGPR